MNEPILKLPLDLTKRHFVCGDIHGHYEALINLLASANYDPETDIVYSVGDVIDRGPDSYECLRFFADNDNAYMINGNHEYFVQEPHHWYDVWMGNGGPQTLHSITTNIQGKGGNDPFSWLQTMLHDNPYCIEVGDDDEKHAFRILHAEFPLDWTDRFLREDCYGKGIGEYNREFQTTIFGRSVISAHLKGHEQQVHPHRKRMTYVGHTPVLEVARVGDLIYTDTWAGKTLSMVEAITEQVWSVPV